MFPELFASGEEQVAAGPVSLPPLCLPTDRGQPDTRLEAVGGIWKVGPGLDGEIGVGHQARHAGEQVRPADIIAEDIVPVQPSHPPLSPRAPFPLWTNAEVPIPARLRASALAIGR